MLWRLCQVLSPLCLCPSSFTALDRELSSATHSHCHEVWQTTMAWSLWKHFYPFLLPLVFWQSNEKTQGKQKPLCTTCSGWSTYLPTFLAPTWRDLILHSWEWLLNCFYTPASHILTCSLRSTKLEVYEGKYTCMGGQARRHEDEPKPMPAPTASHPIDINVLQVNLVLLTTAQESLMLI